MTVSLADLKLKTSGAERAAVIDFTKMSSIPDYLIFDRNQTADFTDANGDAQTAAVDVPRFDHDSNGNPMGILITDNVTDDDELEAIFSQADLPFFDEAEGTMIIRYKKDADTVTASDDYFLTATDNSSQNTISMRSYRTDGQLRGFVRKDNTTQHAAATGYPLLTDVYNTVAISWDAAEGTASIYDQYVTDQETGITLPTGLSHFNFGARNSGQGVIDGHIAYVIFSNKSLQNAERELRRRMYHPSDLVIAGAGQSLMASIWRSVEGDSKVAGANKLAQTLAPFLDDPIATVHMIDSAEGGSAVLKGTGNSEYWWDEDNGVPGPELIDFYEAVDIQGKRPDYILWKQVSADSSSLGTGATTLQEYKDSLLAIFNHMRTTFPDAKIAISKAAGRTDSPSQGSQQGYQDIREYQLELIETYDWCFELPEDFDLSYTDAVHHTAAADLVMAERWGRRLAEIEGKTVTGSTLGPKPLSATFSGTTVTVTIEHDGGTDISPSTGIEGFTIYDDGTEVAVNSAVRTNATTITLTAASSLAGNIEVFYGWGILEGVTQSNLVIDNSSQALPLRARKLLAGTLELLSNGAFSSDTNWTKGSNWSISAGKASADSAAAWLSQNVSQLEDDATYEVTYTVSNYTGGSVRPLLYADSKVGVGVTRTANGTYTEQITISASTSTASDTFVIQGLTSLTADIDNVSLTRV